MAEKQKKQTLITPVGRVSYPSVFKPTKMEGSTGEPKYELTLLFPKSDEEALAPLKRAIAAVRAEKWGPDKSKWPANLRSPFRDGDRDKPNNPEYAGMIFIRMTSQNRPGLVDAAVQPIIDQSQFYPGCYAKAEVNAFAYDKAGNRGMSFGMNNIQKVKDGEPLGGAARPAQEVFEPVEADDPDNYGESSPEDLDEDDDLGL